MNKGGTDDDDASLPAVVDAAALEGPADSADADAGETAT